jgi:hypothetical protein
LEETENNVELGKMEGTGVISLAKTPISHSNKN